MDALGVDKVYDQYSTTEEMVHSEDFRQLVKNLRRPENIHQLDDLDLDAFADMEAVSGKPLIRELLYLISAEIHRPFHNDAMQAWKGREVGASQMMKSP